MGTQEEYAMLSAAAYNAERNPNNKLAITPTGWSQIDQSTNPVNGFGAQAYQKGTEIVIAYEGTNAYSSYSDANGDVMWDRVWSTASDWLFGNLPLTLGRVNGVSFAILSAMTSSKPKADSICLSINWPLWPTKGLLADPRPKLPVASKWADVRNVAVSGQRDEIVPNEYGNVA